MTGRPRRRRDDPDAWTDERRAKCDFLAFCHGDLERAALAWTTYEAQERRPMRETAHEADDGR